MLRSVIDVYTILPSTLTNYCGVALAFAGVEERRKGERKGESLRTMIGMCAQEGGMGFNDVDAVIKQCVDVSGCGVFRWGLLLCMF